MCECQICIKVNKLKVLLLILRLYYILPKIFKVPNKNSTFYNKSVAILRTSDNVTYSFRSMIRLFQICSREKNNTRK